MEWERNKEEEQIRRTRTKKGIEEKKYGAIKDKEKSKHNNRKKRWTDERIIAEEEEEMNCEKS
jgi:hypothetical protein